VWLGDLRNHGGSGREPERRAWRFEDWILKDAPALLAGVRSEIGDRSLGWIGHSAAGVVGLCVLARTIANPPVTSVVAFGAPGPARMGALRWAGAFAFRWTALLLGYFPARALKFGPENEGGHVLGDWMGWNLAGRWLGADGFDYLEGLRRVRTPYLAVAGSNDVLFSPPYACREIVDRIGSDRKELMIAPGFDHKGLLLDSRAGDVLWPRVANWLTPTPLP
jgi:pimeloyl-ACP methyl ester carboxylesterase